MYEKIIQRGVSFIYKYADVHEEDREIYSYGLELILMYFINAGVLLTLGLLIGRFLETLLLLFGFAFMQSFAGGYHAMTHLRCFLFMLLGWAVTMFLIPVISFFPYLLCSFAVLCVIIVFIVAPVKHVNFPMSEVKEAKMRKIARSIAVFMCLLTFISSFLEIRILSATLGITMLMSSISMSCAVLKEMIHEGERS